LLTQLELGLYTDSNVGTSNYNSYPSLRKRKEDLERFKREVLEELLKLTKYFT
jgi:wobble nucleotide-excising tRNase